MIDTLIDKKDSVEVVRDQIAALLALESVAQMAKAVTAGKDPELWRLRVYQERSNPWEALDENNRAPIVNVWWDSSTFDGAAGNVVEYQKCSATINVDCYGYGRSADRPAGGHTAGDQEAAEAVQRAVRLCRNILMAGTYTYLGLRGLVWKRWPESISIFQPQQDNQNHSQVVGARLAMRVDFNELSPQVTPVELELLSVQVLRDEDGLLLVQADYDYTATP